MPPRRRIVHNSAAALPPGRLPLGVPQLGVLRLPTRSSNGNNSSEHLTSLAMQSADNDKLLRDRANSMHRSGSRLNKGVHMPTLQSSENAYATALAEAELQRQNERIQQAEEALSAIPAPNEERQNPRDKTRLKSMDVAPDAQGSFIAAHDARVPPDVQADVCLSRSRTSSLRRSLSSLSQQTVFTAPAEPGCADERLNDNTGFELFTGRKGRKNIEQLSPSERKAEKRQGTTEVALNKREIYEVFGNALPGPEYVDQCVGVEDGQVQFLQSPNGDVSAHQWSTSHYVWENLGWFSSITKRVEGQLAADRLMSETNHTDLQQNTLAYFRAIAKQREALHGRSLHPSAQNVQVAASGRHSTSIEHVSRDFSIGKPVHESSLWMQSRQSSFVPNTDDAFDPSYFNAAGSRPVPTAPRSYNTMGKQWRAPLGRRFDNYNVFMTRLPSTGADWTAYKHTTSQRQEDPFYSSVQTYHEQYPSLSSPQVLSRSAASNGKAAATYGPVHSVATAGSRDSFERLAIGTASAGQSSPTVHIPERHTSVSISANRRLAMREHLKQLGDQAEKRSSTQTAFRTVLFDPFQHQAPTPLATHYEQPFAQQSFSSTGHTMPLLPPPGLHAVPAQQPVESQSVRHSTSFPAYEQAGGDVGERSPKASCVGQSVGLDTTQGSQRAVTHPSREAHEWTATHLPLDAPDKSSAAASNHSDEDELREWWHNGNTLSRHEAMFEHINSINQLAPARSAALAPIGLPSTSATSAQSSSASKTSMTRLLIPVVENLASYVQGPQEERRDYFSQWSQPPEWCIDRSPSGNSSFFDAHWGQPPARVGRDPRFQSTRGIGVSDGGRAVGVESLRFGAFGSPQAQRSPGINLAVGSGLTKSFGYGSGRRL